MLIQKYRQLIKSKISQRNLGLEVLRMILCFWVLVFHCKNKAYNKTLNYIVKKKFHVPCFFFISFFYFFPIIKERNSLKMKLRLERLFIPYILWPTIIWFINNIEYLVINTNRFGRFLQLIELQNQLITGRFFLIPFWFIFHLLFLSIFFYIISCLNQYVFLIFINIIGIIFYFVQYFRINYSFYEKYKDCIAFSVGHFISSYPIAVTALTFNKSNLIQYMEKMKFKYKSLFIYSCILIISFLFIYGTINTYDGIDKNLFSIFAFLFFYLLPLKKYLNKHFEQIIYLMTRYTQGIYCQHTIIKHYFSKALNYRLNFFSCVYLYIICYFLSFIGAKIFGNNKIKYLFI